MVKVYLDFSFIVSWLWLFIRYVIASLFGPSPFLFYKMKKAEENIGLSTYEALRILHNDIAKILEEFSPKIPSR